MGSLFGLTAITGLKSQPTLTMDDIVPNVGEQYMIQAMLPTDMTLPEEGNNQDWDYSSLSTPIGSTDISIIDPGAVPGGPSVADADFVRANTSDGITHYMYVDVMESFIADSYEYRGPGASDFTDADEFGEFPMNMGDSYSGTFAYDNNSSSQEPLSVDGEFTISYVGHGSVSTPGGTYDGVIQVKRTSEETEHNTDSGEMTTIVRTNIAWFKPGIYQPVAQYTRVTEDSDTVDLFTYISSYTSSTEEVNEVRNMEVYPNPAQDILNVNGIKGSKADLEIYDITGRKIIDRKVNRQNNRIDVSDLNQGTYVIRVHGESESYTKKFVVR